MTDKPVFRFAPSPNGNMHLGHAYSALSTYHFSQKMNGRFLLRLEDIDTNRCRQEFIDGIFEDLEWLGIEWEEPVRKQSEHFSDYKNALNKLEEKNLIYPCFATRKEVMEAINAQQKPVYPLDPDGVPIYPSLHKYLSKHEVEKFIREGQAYCYRLNMQAALESISNKASLNITYMNDEGETSIEIAEPQRWGDVIVMRKDTPTSYHLSVVVDDALQNVSHVTRGMDLKNATDLHRLLQELLGLPSPVYYHHKLLLDKNGEKFSKSKSSQSLKDLRTTGYNFEEFLNDFFRDLKV